MINFLYNPLRRLANSIPLRTACRVNAYPARTFLIFLSLQNKCRLKQQDHNFSCSSQWPAIFTRAINCYHTEAEGNYETRRTITAPQRTGKVKKGNADLDVMPKRKISAPTRNRSPTAMIKHSPKPLDCQQKCSQRMCTAISSSKESYATAGLPRGLH
jgi:hypothetical protein